MSDQDLAQLQAEIERVSVAIIAGVVTLTALLWLGAVTGWLW